jgi:Zn-dependent peptidase ImmA (M78 family)
MTSERANINPSVLTWAREQLGLSLDQAASVLGFKLDRLAEWEAGDAKPTEKQLYTLAGKLGQSPAIFFMPELPADEAFPHDFRRLAETDGEIFPQLAREIRRAQRISLEASDLLEDIGSLGGSFEVNGKLNEDPEELGGRIRLALEVTSEMQSSWRKPEAARKSWSELIEQLGVLVLSAERIPLRVFRGVSISTGVPVILLNGQDSDAGRIFTLMHELAHLSLRNAGICSVFDQRLGSNNSNARVEWFCNSVAAAVLMPRDQILAQSAVRSATADSEWPDEELRPLAERFCVSQEAMLVRLMELGKTSSAYYASRRDDFRRAYEAYRSEKKSKSAAIPYKYRVLNKNGRAYTKLVLSALYDNVITTADVASLTGVNLKHMPAIEQELFGRPIVFGHGG